MEKKDSAEKVVRGYDLLFEWIETARLFGNVEEPWCAVEIAHWLQLRRYEILTASDEQTIVSLYHDIFVDDPVAEPLKLCDELRQICLNYPFLLMDERAEGRALFLLAPRASAAVAVTVAVKVAVIGGGLGEPGLGGSPGMPPPEAVAAATPPLQDVLKRS